MLAQKTSKAVSKMLFKNKSFFNFRTTKNLLVQKENPSNLYVEQMFDQWSKDPNSVHEMWRDYFSQTSQQIIEPTLSSSQVSPFAIENASTVAFQAYNLIRNYQVIGHSLADIDPLELQNFKEFGKKILKYDYLGTNLTEAQKKATFSVSQGPWIKEIAHFLEGKDTWSIGEIIEICKKIYTGKIGFEYYHIENVDEKLWLQKRIEDIGLKPQNNVDRKKTLERLLRNEQFNLFLKNRFSTSKRFGIEGCDSFISGLGALVDHACENGVQSLILGMPHRGRLNTLACVFNKNPEQIFAEFQEIRDKSLDDAEWGNSGDVKYHLGCTTEKVNPSGKKIKMSILPNPSHLETVNPVTMGCVRAVQDFKGDSTGLKTLGVLVHGDSSFSGQGVVYESLQMQELVGYSPRGIVHIIVNNQIGFTTTPAEYRTGLYSTDVMKSVESPIFHVNADEPDLVDAVFRLAVDYRNTFHKDVMVDIIGYRLFGHNELDEPRFTQPMMYSKIEKMTPVYQKYSKRLLDEGVITQAEIEELEKHYTQALTRSYMTSKEESFNVADWKAKPWEVVDVMQTGGMKGTAFDLNMLKDIGKKICEIPTDFNIHPQLKKIFQARQQSVETGEHIDMATAEALAFATLLTEGFNIRISGQDVERGTFSQRHAVLNDQVSVKKIKPILQCLPENQRNDQRFTVVNSHLSEYGVLGFEYGYSITNPNCLTIWEGQFGDFANGAQIIIDNYLASGEAKWNVQTGLVVLLPHGMDGQGPEHSSGRMERFLQMCDDDIQSAISQPKTRQRGQGRKINWSVICCSFSANYFHALRRQMHRDFRKPLIAFTSKKLLRFKPACSNIKEFTEFTDNPNLFKNVVPETEKIVESSQVKKVVICSGQVYWDLVEYRQEHKKNDIAIVRIEQIAPFPYEDIRSAIQNYKNAEFIWCQEEHENSGAWTYIEPRLEIILDELKSEGSIKHNKLNYIGRKRQASTATGSTKVHKLELESILKKIFN
ncbi:oxoglutarate dehydrogenase (succinyl-transferring), E1 component (macronuclear) [Tetrahymena thermophila SB210]|uniref:2-oxoglutarate dehydrogenase, mitochondrial n=1 Tax=Tetrahymena thermophila (strain SB210) TaxID=312017 RepID=Q23KH1_TETTS|nr:oxoglutarate dehydrogenase (succinyl-transferring), E1 component [Tetrahymena thermophila SB210]EAR96872.1 oxoglutarate dehydrogenase (succinyl-transferring), E1 component [Tetrahymena thermophila SB210]|eukprot:XP_001017117.1 oxoglutarate dehydrogenase (succinyl-transferring), E1 component [Tetrahymena thermophila SB210]